MFEPSNGNCHFAFMNVGLSHSRWEWERLLDRPGWRADTEEHILAKLDRFIRHSSIDRITKEVKAPAPERLTFLNLDCIFHGDAYLPYLGPFKKLEVLRLCQSGVTDAGLQSLPDLPELREIYLNATSVTDAGAAALARFPKLEILFATKTGITDEGIKALAPTLPSLRKLVLIATAVTDASVDALSNMMMLEELDLCQTAVSAEGLERLRQALPKCKILPLGRPAPCANTEPDANDDDDI
ncbi:hypothetical protein [Singulisphaera sp. PoT]|uniref:hypothetical protein n=1 Tax=Singulisphaera sp. PoT TaxID=3411797 RepID=UPI003BF4E66F